MTDKLLECVYEVRELPAFDLPSPLGDLYDGRHGFTRPRVYANFVTSLDGTVALPSVQASPSVISGHNEADRFVMALLRASADAVLVGASTVRAEPGHSWTPKDVYPKADKAFALLRHQLGLSERPELFILTATGDLDPGVRALREGAVVLTTRAGETKLRGVVEKSSIVRVGQGDRIDVSDVLDIIRSRGHDLVLTEGGPTLFGQLVSLELVDELFLTISPLLTGRSAIAERPGLIRGVDLLPKGLPRPKLLSLRRSGSHLFARYSLTQVESNAGGAAHEAVAGAATLSTVAPRIR